MGAKRKFDVCTPRPKYAEQGKVWWHRVGNAVENDNGQITVFLDSVPVPDPARENKIVMMLFEPRDDNADRRPAFAASTNRATRKPVQDDDEIPF